MTDKEAIDWIGCLKCTNRDAITGAVLVDDIDTAIDMSIKALGEAEKRHWIPCSEGFPECYLIRDCFNRPQCYMSDSVLVTVKSEECDGVHYFVGTDMMSGNTKDGVHWLMSCGYGGSAVYKQEIIAWMPKPDPYKTNE